MTRSILLKSVLCALMVPTLSCNLLNVSDNEESNSGRGAKVFDPYQGNNSGALRLSLQSINGCAVLPTYQTVAKTPPAANYPSLCPDMFALDPFAMPVAPTGQFQILGKTQYFLNQLTITDTVVNQHMGPEAAARWITEQSRFRNLDWSGVSSGSPTWKFIDGFDGSSEDTWTQEVLFQGARWQQVKDDSFKLEVLDRDGVVRTMVEYKRSELLAETAYAGHSRFSWRVENLAPPLFPGDTELRGVPGKPNRTPQFPTPRTLARLDLVGSTNPFMTFTTPDLKGPGALRVTWSQLPNEPFYFPVTFTPPEEVSATCTNDSGQAVPCAFGLDPRLNFAPPRNGQFYEPGETVHMYVDLRDSVGNRLHAPDLLPSVGEILANNANGIVMTHLPYLSSTAEADSSPMVTVSGPLHRMKVQSDPNVPPEFLAREYPFPFIEDLATSHIGPTLYNTKVPTRYSRKLPANAEPGTYVAIIKFTRFFMGERISKMQPFFFQVGTKELTRYPDAVGNCQICHRGVLSLDNLRHGMSVDHVEGCKACHLYGDDLVGRLQESMHRIHMNSTRYMADKNDCTMCHLTRQSAARPSVAVCASCHPSVHGNEYFQQSFSQSGVPNRFGNCAQSCHVDKLPSTHIFPEN